MGTRIVKRGALQKSCQRWPALQRVLVDRAAMTAVRCIFDAVAVACADAVRRPASAARRSPRGPTRPVLRPEVTARRAAAPTSHILPDAIALCLALLWPASEPAILHHLPQHAPKDGNHAVILTSCWDQAKLMCSGFAANHACVRQCDSAGSVGGDSVAARGGGGGRAIHPGGARRV